MTVQNKYLCQDKTKQYEKYFIGSNIVPDPVDVAVMRPEAREK